MYGGFNLQKASGRNVLSGTKDCHEQITGQRNGCYKQDLSYRIDQPERYKLSVFNKRTWGECALTCKEDDLCTFWTWASTSCSNCVRGVCDIFTGGEEEPNIEGDHRGHISGSRQCQDIGYLSNKLPDASKVHSALVDPTPFPVGFCQSQCPAQQVPGFRYLGLDPKSIWVGHPQSQTLKVFQNGERYAHKVPKICNLLSGLGLILFSCPGSSIPDLGQ